MEKTFGSLDEMVEGRAKKIFKLGTPSLMQRPHLQFFDQLSDSKLNCYLTPSYYKHSGSL